MYQIKCSNGYEIQVIGSGKNGLCRVQASTGGPVRIVHTGTYAECQKWLADRGIFETAAGQTHA